MSVRLADRKFVARRPVISPAKLVFANAVLASKLGREAKSGLNKNRDPRRALGDVSTREPEQFLSLGAFGTVTLGVTGQIIVGGADDDVTVFIRPDEELRPYRVEVLVGGARPRWVLLGESPGSSQSFSLRDANVKSAVAVRITDTSGRTRTNELRGSSTPGISPLGVGFRKTAKHRRRGWSRPRRSSRRRVSECRIRLGPRSRRWWWWWWRTVAIVEAPVGE